MRAPRVAVLVAALVLAGGLSAGGSTANASHDDGTVTVSGRDHRGSWDCDHRSRDWDQRWYPRHDRHKDYRYDRDCRYDRGYRYDDRYWDDYHDDYYWDDDYYDDYYRDDYYRDDYYYDDYRDGCSRRYRDCYRSYRSTSLLSVGLFL